MEPSRNHDGRAAHSGETMHEQVTPLNAVRHCRHDFLKLWSRNQTRLRNRDVEIFDPVCLRPNFFCAEGDDACDAKMI